MARQPVPRNFPDHFLPHCRVHNLIEQLPLSFIAKYDLAQLRAVDSARAVFQEDIIPESGDDLGVTGCTGLNDAPGQEVGVDDGDAMRC